MAVAGGEIPDVDIFPDDVDINESITNEELKLINNKDILGERTWWNRFKKFFSKDKGLKFTKDEATLLIQNPTESDTKWNKRVREVIEMKELERKSDVIEKSIEDGGKTLQKLYPRWNPKNSPFVFKGDEVGNVEVSIKKKGTKKYYLNPDGVWSGNLPDTITDSLGRSKHVDDEYIDAKKELDTIYPQNKLPDKYEDTEHELDVGCDEDDNDSLVIYDKKSNTWKKIYNKDGSLNKKLSKELKSILGQPAIEIADGITKDIEQIDKKQKHFYADVKILDQKIDDEASSIISNQESIKELEDTIDEAYDKLHSGNFKEKLKESNARRDNIISIMNEQKDSIKELVKTKKNLEDKIRDLEAQKENLENERESIEEKLPLRERIKQIIKRHGLTVTGVALAVGTIIGVIINSLKSGLTSVAKGVGNGLKSLGQKLSQILPGMVGAIASFIFKTAGKVLSFVAKNAWLLIVAVVLYVVERYKNKR